jgi:hypothetical protein
MRTRFKSALILIACVALLVSCATVTLTGEQKAQIAVDSAQGQLGVWFDTAKAYYTAHPEKVAEWKGTVNPAFDTANKSLGRIIPMLKAGTITPDAINTQIAPILQDVLVLLTKQGVLK